MAMSNAERQRKFRKDHQDDTCRLDMRISVEAFFALNRLAKSDRVTKRQFLEELLIQLDNERVSEMTDEEMDAYWDSDITV